jgi:hypothetical protein
MAGYCDEGEFQNGYDLRYRHHKRIITMHRLPKSKTINQFTAELLTTTKAYTEFFKEKMEETEGKLLNRELENDDLKAQLESRGLENDALKAGIEHWKKKACLHY